MIWHFSTSPYFSNKRVTSDSVRRGWMPVTKRLEPGLIAPSSSPPLEPVSSLLPLEPEKLVSQKARGKKTKLAEKDGNLRTGRRYQRAKQSDGVQSRHHRGWDEGKRCGCRARNEEPRLQGVNLSVPNWFEGDGQHRDKTNHRSGRHWRPRNPWMW